MTENPLTDLRDLRGEEIFSIESSSK